MFIFITGPVDLTTFRIPGVLQRLAFTYFCVALVETIFATPDDPYIVWWTQHSFYNILQY